MIRGHIFIRILLFLLLLLGAGAMLHFSWLEQKGFQGSRTEDYLKVSRNAPILTYDAKEEYLFDANLLDAEQKLTQALMNNSLYVPAWLTLASVANDKGEKKRANAILDYTGTLTAELLKWRWDKTLVAYELGRNELLPTELQFIINRIPGKTRNSALELAFQLFPEPEELQKQVGGGNSLHLFHHTLRKKNIPAALYFLEVLEEEQVELSQRDKLWWINTLIGAGELERAGNFWSNWFNPDRVVYNGDFSKKFIRTAFGWRIGSDTDFTQKFIPEKVGGEAREIQFRFKGWKNLSFAHFYQIIPVQQGTTYQFSASMKSQRLTTDQRPFFQVYGYKCTMKPINFTMVEPEQDWTKNDEIFDVPDGCSAVVLRLRRPESRQIDNKMSGKLWIKDVQIIDDCDQCGPIVPEELEEPLPDQI